MKGILERFKRSSLGSYFIFATVLFSLISFILCLVGSATSYQSWGTFVCFLLLILVDIALFVFDKFQFAPAINTILSALGIGLFIYACYNYVATVFTGIDIESFSIDFIFSLIFYFLTYGFSIASIFLPLYKKGAAVDEKDKVTE